MVICELVYHTRLFIQAIVFGIIFKLNEKQSSKSGR